MWKGVAFKRSTPDTVSPLAFDLANLTLEIGILLLKSNASNLFGHLWDFACGAHHMMSYTAVIIRELFNLLLVRYRLDASSFNNLLISGTYKSPIWNRKTLVYSSCNVHRVIRYKLQKIGLNSTLEIPDKWRGHQVRSTREHL